jgi:hypothetical protein
MSCYTDASTGNHHDGVLQVGLAYICQDLGDERDTAVCGNVGQTNDAGVGGTMEEDEVAEVLVHRDEHAVFGDRPLQEDVITRIFAALTRLQDVVALAAQPVGEPPAGAAVDEELHAEPTLTASSRSWAMTAWA